MKINILFVTRFNFANWLQVDWKQFVSWRKNPWRRIGILLKKKTSLQKKFWSSIVKFSLLHGLRAIKYNSKIFNIYYHIKCRKSRKNIMNICSTKKLFLKILGYSQENTCVGVSFLITLQAFSHPILLKRDLQHRCLPVNTA